MNKPNNVPHDIWRTCNEAQRQWILKERRREQIALIQRRQDAAKPEKMK